VIDTLDLVYLRFIVAYEMMLRVCKIRKPCEPQWNYYISVIIVFSRKLTNRYTGN